MSFSRRTVAGILPCAFGPAEMAALPASQRCGSTAEHNPIIVENRHYGSSKWRIGSGTRPATDRDMQIKGYASKASINLGESLDFHVSTDPSEEFSIDIYRFGHYSGAGARLMTTSPRIAGKRQVDYDFDDSTGMISCTWASVWTLDLPDDWVSGCYLAVFTTVSGWRSYYPFVVRDDRRQADLCVVLPLSTYQAYNMWPQDGRRGKSLYYGYEPVEQGETRPAPTSYARRARKVSFDRPYAGDGKPQGFDTDLAFISWAESLGYDMTYASTFEMHQGTIRPANYVGIVYCGHDEYWSRQMRENAADAVSQDVSLAFMSANNVYWHVKFEPSPDGRHCRVLVCYKTDPDPDADKAAGETRTWRAGRPGPSNAEQSLLGVMYNGVLKPPVPLVVQNAHHWFWSGTGVTDGDRIENVVGWEADGFFPAVPGPSGVRHTLLSASPYTRSDTKTEQIQNTSVYETANDAIVFVAGSLTWAESLVGGERCDVRIQRATANVLDRIVDRRARKG